MAIYTTLFTATDAELTEFFPGWQVPLSAPQKVMGINPFNGQELAVSSWCPKSTIPNDEQPTPYVNRGRQILPPALPIDGDWQEYQRWWEENAPPLLRTLPHVALKGITEFELQELGVSLVGDQVPPARFVLCRDGAIGAIQASAIPLLASASEQQLRDYSAKWHDRLQEGDPGHLQWVLLRIRALAADAVSREANLFSHARTFV